MDAPNGKSVDFRGGGLPVYGCVCKCEMPWSICIFLQGIPRQLSQPVTNRALPVYSDSIGEWVIPANG